MLVKAIDHVNILTYDVDGTAEFYVRALGMRRGISGGAKMGYKGAWMHDAHGHPLVHIGLKDPERDYGPEHVPGAITGAFHHVAFACEDFDSAKARLDLEGIAYSANEGAAPGPRQIILKDPNNINIELNFTA